MKEKKGAKKARILNALLEGRVLTAFDANIIGKTTEGARVIRSIREKYPVLKAQVAGENYFQYWIDKDYLESLKQIGKDVKNGCFFDKLLELWK